MSDIAAYLVDEVLPKVPIRQWVCSLPWRLRYAMGYDRERCADVLAAFIGALRRSLRRRAKRELGSSTVEDGQVGAITFVQRGDSSLRLIVHFHTLVPDGVYVRDAAGVLCFHGLPNPSPEQVADVARRTHEQLVRVCERHGRSLDQLDDGTDELAHDQPALAACYGASIHDQQLLVALIPPPRFHLLRYHGVLAAHAKARSEVVPDRAPERAEPTQLKLLFDGEATEFESGTRPASRHPAWLLQRVFAVDVMVCPRCRGPMQLVEIANERDGIARVLATVGLGPRPPPRPRPPLPGQLKLKLAA